MSAPVLWSGVLLQLSHGDSRGCDPMYQQVAAMAHLLQLSHAIAVDAPSACSILEDVHTDLQRSHGCRGGCDGSHHKSVSHNASGHLVRRSPSLTAFWSPPEEPEFQVARDPCARMPNATSANWASTPGWRGGAVWIAFRFRGSKPLKGCRHTAPDSVNPTPSVRPVQSDKDIPDWIRQLQRSYGSQPRMRRHG